MSGYQEKLKDILQGKKNLTGWRESNSEPDMAEMLELSDQEFKTTLINMLGSIMGNIDSMQEQAM